MSVSLLIWFLIFPPHLLTVATVSTGRLTKCCPLGKALMLPADSRKSPNVSASEIPKCLPLSKTVLRQNKPFSSSQFFDPTILSTKASSNISGEVLSIKHLPSLCSQGRPDYALAENVSRDGFAHWGGVERPYDCVDQVLEKGERQGRGRKEMKSERRKFAALVCPGPASCPAHHRCIEKCCREGQLLVRKKGKRSKLVCVHGFPLWRPEEQKGVINVVRNSIFYKVKNLEICFTNSSQYSFTQDGSLLSTLNNSSTRRYCVDFLQEEEGGKFKEVVLTQPRLCAKDDRKDDEDGGGAGRTVSDDRVKVLYIACAVLSLGCLTLTFLIYWFIPSYNHLAGKIVLINVVSTALLSIFLLLLYFVAPSTFHLECAKEGIKACVFIRSYACPLIGYFGYFTFIGAFAWMTVMGFDLCWRFFTSEGRDHTTGSRSKL